MANIQFLFDNLLDSAILTESSAAIGFPVSNLRNPFLSKVWRTLGTTPGTATLDIDLAGTPNSTTCIALAGYSWAAAPGTLQLLFDDSSNHGSPEHTETLTWKANPTTNGNNGIIIQNFASYDEKYLRLNVVNAPGDWDLGRIFIGTYFEPTYNYDPHPTIDLIDESMRSQTIGGQRHFDEIDKYRRVSFSCTVVSQTQWELFQAMINTVGTSKSLFIAFDYTNEPDEMTIYGKFTRLPSAQGFAYAGYILDFEFEEDR